jgi:hypothetical protein
LPRFFISNGKKRKESRIAERHERECVREAEHCGKRKIGSPTKPTVRE